MLFVGAGYAYYVLDGPRYVVVCRGPHCRERGSVPLRQRLVELLRGQEHARLVGYACFGQCELGPNVAFYPEAVWYGGLSRPEDAERVVQHAVGARRLPDPPLSLPEHERREHLANIAELVTTLERDRFFPRFGRPRVQREPARTPWWRRWLPLPSRG